MIINNNGKIESRYDTSENWNKYNDLQYGTNNSSDNVEWSNNCEHANKADNASISSCSKQSYYTILTNGTDLNNITTAGWYGQSESVNNDNNRNMPETKIAFHLYVINDHKVQFWFRYDGRACYTRRYKSYDDIGWQHWKQIYS